MDLRSETRFPGLWLLEASGKLSSNSLSSQSGFLSAVLKIGYSGSLPPNIQVSLQNNSPAFFYVW